jgi:hypothetical protein
MEAETFLVGGFVDIYFVVLILRDHVGLAKPLRIEVLAIYNDNLLVRVYIELFQDVLIEYLGGSYPT